MIIEVDEYKKQIPGYDPERSEDFHSESGKLADKQFVECLKSKKYKRIIFMAGGTASGKTEFACSYLYHNDQLVYDGTQKSFDGLKVKLDKMNRYDKNNSKIKIVFVLPKDPMASFEAFLSRERKMNIETFFYTHIHSKLTIAKILRETKIRVEIYISSISKNKEKLSYDRLTLYTGRLAAAKNLEILARHEQGVAKNFNIDISI